MANIYDVARQARVSVATVSAVVNDSAYVSPSLKARVKDAIRKLGYRPNLLARSLAKQQSHMLGMIVPNIANPFWPEVVRGAEDQAQAAGYSLLLASSDDNPRKEELYLNLFLSKRVDGILLAKAPGPISPPIADEISRSRISIVQLARRSGSGTDAVLIDDRGAAYEGVTHLLRLGCRRIAMINGIGNVSTSRQRLAGYRQALRDWDCAVDPTLVVQGDFRVDSGYTQGVDLLKQRPDAVFIANYLMAVGFMKALRQYRLRCPQDIAIVTCDDYPWLDSFSPRLTTVNLPKYELGYEGARVLVERVANRAARPRKQVVLKSALAIRESCGYHLRALNEQTAT